MSELREVYGETVDFVIVPAEQTKARSDEIERYNLSARKHGLVAFETSGAAVFTLAGHNFGKPEIELAVAQIVKP